MEQENTPDSPPASGNLSTTHDKGPPPVVTDAHGFNPDDYDWVPVRKKNRSDGCSPEKQRKFIETLADTGSVTMAARLSHMSRDSAYKLRRSPGGEGFAAAWDIAIEQASKQLADIAFDRAINGVDDPVLDKEGHFVYMKTKYNDRLLMFLMRAHAPQRYRHAHRDSLAPGEQLPPPSQPMSEAMKLLGPVVPKEPHKLMDPNDLEVALQCADMMPGELPHWLRDQDFLRAEREEKDIAEGRNMSVSPSDEELERQLAAANRAAAGLPPTEEDDEYLEFWDDED